MHATTSDQCRAPDWRFLIAQELHRAGKFATRAKYDWATRMAHWYLGARDRTTMQPTEVFSTINSAHALYALRPEDAKYAVEAYILTGATDDEISAEFGLTAKLINWYERLFFDVRGRLASRIYIQNQLIPEREKLALDPKDGLWKRIACIDGVAALKKAVFSETTAESMTKIQGQVNYMMTMRCLDAVETLPAQHAAKVIAVADSARGRSDAGLGIPSLEANIQATLELMPFGVAVRDKDPNSPTFRFDQAGIELQSWEETLLRAGYQLPHLEELLKVDVFANARKAAELNQ
jgi:hypothetical protein